ncbi:DUF1707 domain-containing protein [Actinomycetes bacterium KLBMP 9797]
MPDDAAGPRIGHAARQAAMAVLVAALHEGRLTLVEYDRRVRIVVAAKTSNDLAPVLADLPSHQDASGPHLRPSAMDRERALVALASALADGRMDAEEYATAESLVRQASSYTELQPLVAGLDTRVSLAERVAAITRIDAATEAGVLTPAERLDRIAAVESATSDAQVAALIRDLAPADPRTPAAGGDRASHADRDAVLTWLQAALTEGYIDLGEFDERTRAAYGARLRAELVRLVADLPAHGTQPPLASYLRAYPSPAPVRPAATGPVPPVINAPSAAPSPAPTPPPPPPPPPVSPAEPAESAPPMPTPPPAPPVRARPGPSGDRGPVRDLGAAFSHRSPGRRARRRAHGRDLDAVPGGILADRSQPTRQSSHRFELSGHRDGVTAITCLVLRDGVPVAITGSDDGTAIVWDLRDGSRQQTLRADCAVTGVAGLVLSDGTPVGATIHPDNTLRTWDLRDGAPRAVLHPVRDGEYRAVASLTLPDGTRVAVTAGSGGGQLWDLRRNVALRRVGDGDQDVSAVAAIVTPGGRALAVLAGSSQLTVWDLEDNYLRHSLTGHGGWITAVACLTLPDGMPAALTADADGDGAVRVWDVHWGAQRQHFPSHRGGVDALAGVLLPDGTPAVITVSSLRKVVEVRSLADGAVRTAFTTGGGQAVAGLALPGATLVLAGHETVQVHELR